jgi:hypothetical protein
MLKPGNRAVFFELEGPRGGLRMGVVLRGSLADEALTFVDTLCFIHGLPPAEWQEVGQGLAWSYQDQARGVKAEARVTPWGLRQEG